MPLIKFLKDYKRFKSGQFLEFPNERYTGQVELALLWEEVRGLIEDGVAVEYVSPEEFFDKSVK